jgi:hypothetical protein
MNESTGSLHVSNPMRFNVYSQVDNRKLELMGRGPKTPVFKRVASVPGYGRLLVQRERVY